MYNHKLKTNAKELTNLQSSQNKKNREGNNIGFSLLSILNEQRQANSPFCTHSSKCKYLFGEDIYSQRISERDCSRPNQLKAAVNYRTH